MSMGMWTVGPRFHSSKEDSRGGLVSLDSSDDESFPFLKGRFKSSAAPLLLLNATSFHSSKEDSRAWSCLVPPVQYLVSIPQRKIQELARLDRLPPHAIVSIPQRKIQEFCVMIWKSISARFPFLKGRFKRRMGHRPTSSCCCFHSSKEDSRDADTPAARLRACRFHSSKEDSRVATLPLRPPPCIVSIPQRKIQEPMHRHGPRPLLAVSIPQRKIQEPTGRSPS